MARQRNDASPALSPLLNEIASCRRCRDQPIGTVLPHEPRPVLRASATARLCVAGQAPGTRVHASGIPFTDPSGDRLREWLAIDRAAFYDVSCVAIVPMGFCFPGLSKSGSDLPPRRECALAWHDKVFSQLTELRLILAIGAFAHAHHIGDLAGANVTETVRSWRSVVASTSERGGVAVFPLPHPSWRNSGWLKRNPWFQSELLPELRLASAKAIG
jgi:uracil-DNA glycosylase